MKKISLVIIFLASYSICFGVALFCEYQSAYSWPDGSTSTTNNVYYTENGNCCNPSSGYGVSTYTYYSINGWSAWHSEPESNSTLAESNPNCSKTEMN